MRTSFQVGCLFKFFVMLMLSEGSLGVCSSEFLCDWIYASNFFMMMV